MPRPRLRPVRGARPGIHRLRTALLAAVTAAATLLIPPALADSPAAPGLSPAEARGQHLYTRGESQSRRVVTALVERGAPPAPASILPCIHCHGVNGRGRPDDAGIVPPDITWGVLTDPGGHRHAGRAHGPYDEASLARAISEGLDPAAATLDPGMPRYRMADADMADLIAYLRRIEHQLDQGLSADGVRIGTVLPLAGPLQGTGQAIRDVLEAWFDRVNGSGGVHGRRLELVVAGFGGQDTPSIWAAQDLLAGSDLFALVAAYVPGYEDEMVALATDKQVPLVGPYALVVPDSGPAGRLDFHVLPGLGQQTDALVEAAAALPDPPARLAVVTRDIPGLDALADRAAARAEARGLGPAAREAYEPGSLDAGGTVSRLKDRQVDAVVFLGSAEDFGAFAGAAGGLDWFPYLLAPALLAERAVPKIPPGFGPRVLLAYPSLPGDRTAEGVEAFEAVHAVAGLDPAHSVAQVAAFTAARVLVEGLQRAGPDPDRGGLIAALEGMSAFRPGLTPPVTFGRDRRLGPGGAYVVEVDVASGTLDGSRAAWIDLSGD